MLLILSFSKCDIIPVLTDIAQSAVKEKVIRVVVATFRVGLLIHLGQIEFDANVS